MESWPRTTINRRLNQQYPPFADNSSPDEHAFHAEQRSRLRGRTDCGPSAQMRIEAKAFIELVAAFSTLSITSDIPPNEVR
jgi:hypothetical protein